MSIYEVILQTDFRGVEVVNRFNYVGAGTPAVVSGSFALASAIGAVSGASNYPLGTLLRAIAGLMHTSAKFTLLTVNNVYNPDDFYSAPFVPDFPGVMTGESLSPVMAVGFYSNRVTRNIRRATKRFTGISEGYVVDGGFLNTAGLTASATVATAMGAILQYNDEGNTLSFSPAVVSKEKYQSNTSPVRWAYKYYPTLDEQMTHVAQGIRWDVYPQLRSQASRQYGHGR